MTQGSPTVYASNGTITIETRPDQIIITDRFGDNVHLTPADAEFVRDALDPVNTAG
jgi:hypothetical protein